MDKKPLFSIIIPTYNRAGRLKYTLNSLEFQSVKDFEVIICDDGSTDNTKQVVDDYINKLNIQYIYEKNWGGPARPRNNGLKISTGYYIAFLDSGDYWYPKKLEIINNHFRNNNIDICYHDLDIATNNGKKLFKKIKGRHLRKPVFIDLMRNENALITSSVVVKKSIVNQVGGFTEDVALISVEDFDLWLKISRVTEKFNYIPQSLGGYWVEGGSISEASEKMINRITSVYHKYLNLLRKNDRKQSETIMMYLLGRTKQKMGLLEESLKLFNASVKSQNLKYRFRSLYWILLIGARLLLSKKKYAYKNN